MIDQDVLVSLQELLPTVSSAIVAVGREPKLDQVATGIAVAQWLRHRKIRTELVCPDELSAPFREIPGADQFSQKLGSQNLVVSFPYSESVVDQVSYHINDDQTRFFLTIKPQLGTEPLDSSLVEFDYTGSSAELIFLIGVHDFEQLEHLYSTAVDTFDQAVKVTLNSFVPAIATYAIDTSEYSSLAEGAAAMIVQLNDELESSFATALLVGIEAGTDGLQSATTRPETLEMAANLIRAGARRIYRKVSMVPDHNQNVTHLKTQSHSSVTPAGVSSINAFSAALSKKIETKDELVEGEGLLNAGEIPLSTAPTVVGTNVPATVPAKNVHTSKQTKKSIKPVNVQFQLSKSGGGLG